MSKILMTTLLTVILLFACFSMAAADMIFRPYAKGGFLLTKPSASDLGYSDAGGDPSSLDQYLDVNKINGGVGIQLLMDPGMSTGPSGLKIGIDGGAQYLFTADFDTGADELPYIDVDNDRETEFDAYMMGIIELAPSASSLILQGGLGLHFVFWTWESNYSGTYSSDYSEESGLDTNVGLMAAAGLNLPAGPNMNIPLMLRIDYILRYGGTATVSGLIGLSFEM